MYPSMYPPAGNPLFPIPTWPASSSPGRPWRSRSAGRSWRWSRAPGLTADRLGTGPARCAQYSAVSGTTPPAGPDSCGRVSASSPDPECVRLTEQAGGPVADPGAVLLDRGHGCQRTGKRPGVRGDGSAGPGGGASSPRCRRHVANSPVAAGPSPRVTCSATARAATTNRSSVTRRAFVATAEDDSRDRITRPGRRGYWLRAAGPGVSLRW
jgi:hypothetical protein